MDLLLQFFDIVFIDWSILLLTSDLLYSMVTLFLLTGIFVTLRKFWRLTFNG